MSIEIITFGCRLNSYESSIIKQNAKKHGIKNIIIINTCSVTQEAEKKAYYTIKKIKRKFPYKKIIVTGCSVQINPHQYHRMNEIDFIYGNKEKINSKIFDNLVNRKEKIIVNNIVSIQNKNYEMIEKFQNRSRAFIQIQNGCNHKCTFCIIPLGRGLNRSIPIESIIKYTKKMIGIGYKEIVLTGVDITDYGYDIYKKMTLGNMLKILLKKIPNIKRLRLSSIDASEVNDELLEVIINEKKIMPYVHLSLQSGDDIILKRMKRRHKRYQIIQLQKKIRELRPEIVFGADIIAGFPTENEEMFNNTYNILLEMPIIHAHIFPYSIRKNTPASRMPQVKKSIIKNRAIILRKTANQLLSSYLQSKIGSIQKVLVEKNSYGLTEDFCKVKVPENLKCGEIYNLRINNATKNCLNVIN